VTAIYVLVGFAALAAAVTTAYVMRRIDDGRVRGIGPWLGLLVPLFAMTIAAARALLERTSWAESGPYAVALLVLVGAACIWLVLPISTLRNQMWGPPSGGPGPAEAGPHVNSATHSMEQRSPEPDQSKGRQQSLASAAMLLLVSGAAMIAVLGVVAVGASRFAVLPQSSAGFLTHAVGAGLLAMAMIQGIRTLVPVRGAFHCAAVVRWIDESIASVKLEGKSSNDMLREITELASPASSLGHYALFDLPIEQLCGQIGAGADRLLDDSASKVRLAAATMPEAVPADAPQPHKATNVITVLAASSTEVQQFLDGSPPYPPTEPRDRMRLRADIAQRIQRNIDRLQISTTFWWRRLLRGLAVAICWTLGLTLLKDAVAAVVFAIAGGFVATVARDLVAIVEKSRR